MTPQKVSTPEVVTFDDLRTMAEAVGPCITIGVEIPDPQQIRPRVKNSIRDPEKSLEDFGVDKHTAAMLMGPIQNLASSVEMEGQWHRDLVLFRSRELFRYFSVLELDKGFVEVGEEFQIRPLLSQISVEQRFYILALSQKHVRLLRGSYRSVEEVPLRGVVPQNLETWLNARIPDHVLDNRSSGGPSTGSMKGVMFGTNSDQDRSGEYLAHFFRAIDSGLRKILGAEDAPLILAGVLPETKLYARVNSYPRLLEETVQGSPEKLSANELQKRSIEIARHTFTRLLSKTMQDVKQRSGTNRVVTDTDSILKAACEGRVSVLLLCEDAERRGAWDEATQEVLPGDQDLLNLAALRTLSHGGHAFALPSSAMPEPASMVALLRF
jgi:hypothetical protein